MTNTEKQLLMVDLCARLPYGVKCADFKYDNNGNKIDTVEVLGIIHPEYQNYSYVGALATHEISRIKPYLRPMSSMTEEEDKELRQMFEIELSYLASNEVGHTVKSAAGSAFQVDFYNRHHFDFRGLIEMGLALEAPEGMYKTE